MERREILPEQPSAEKPEMDEKEHEAGRTLTALCGEMLKKETGAEEKKNLLKEIGRALLKQEPLFVLMDESSRNRYPCVDPETGSVRMFVSEASAERRKDEFGSQRQVGIRTVREGQILPELKRYRSLGIESISLEADAEDDRIAAEIAIRDVLPKETQVNVVDYMNRPLRFQLLKKQQFANAAGDGDSEDGKSSEAADETDELIGQGVFYVLTSQQYVPNRIYYSSDAMEKSKHALDTTNSANLTLLPQGTSEYRVIHSGLQIQTAVYRTHPEKKQICIFTEYAAAEIVRKLFKSRGKECAVSAMTYKEIFSYASQDCGIIIDLLTFGKQIEIPEQQKETESSDTIAEKPADIKEQAPTRATDAGSELSPNMDPFIAKLYNRLQDTEMKGALAGRIQMAIAEMDSAGMLRSERLQENVFRRVHDPDPKERTATKAGIAKAYGHSLVLSSAPTVENGTFCYVTKVNYQKKFQNCIWLCLQGGLEGLQISGILDKLYAKGGIPLEYRIETAGDETDTAAFAKNLSVLNRMYPKIRLVLNGKVAETALEDAQGKTAPVDVLEKTAPVETQEKTEEKEEQKPVDIAESDLKERLTGSLVACYRSSNQSLYRDEYLRRLQIVSFTKEQAEQLFQYELNMLDEAKTESMSRKEYLQSAFFNMKGTMLNETEEYYIQHRSFLISEITKIWDEAEYIYEYRKDEMNEEVYSEIHPLTRYGGGDLFIDYLKSVAENTSIPMKQIQMYSVAEQDMMFKYKWYKNRNEKHPYGEETVLTAKINNS